MINKKITISTFILLSTLFSSFSQEHPWTKYGFTPKVITLSNGKYNEFHDITNIVEIGSVLFDTETKEIIGFIISDTITSDFIKPHIISRWVSPDPLAEEYSNWSPYNYVMNNPIILADPTGEYPVITITANKTGKTADQLVLGYSGGVTTQTDLYKVTVTDTEDANFSMSFSVTRDAWTVEQGNGNTASNVGFEPKDGDVNHFTGKVMPNGYPYGNDTESLKLTQYGSEVVHAEPNETSVKMGYRDKADVAKGIMLHVGGNYEKDGKNKVAASEGCFGIVNPNNSSSNQSNDYSNNILKAIINQANNSQVKPGHIRVIIEKREGNDYPKTKTVR